jgi:hypothetical protein
LLKEKKRIRCGGEGKNRNKRISKVHSSNSVSKKQFTKKKKNKKGGTKVL